MYVIECKRVILSVVRVRAYRGTRHARVNAAVMEVCPEKKAIVVLVSVLVLLYTSRGLIHALERESRSSNMVSGASSNMVSGALS